MPEYEGVNTGWAITVFVIAVALGWAFGKLLIILG